MASNRPMTTGDPLSTRVTFCSGALPPSARRWAAWHRPSASRLWSMLCVLVLLSLGGRAAAADDIEFRAEVDRETVAMDEAVTLTITLSGNLSQVPGVDLGDIPDFDVTPRGHRQQMG